MKIRISETEIIDAPKELEQDLIKAYPKLAENIETVKVPISDPANKNEANGKIMTGLTLDWLNNIRINPLN